MSATRPYEDPLTLIWIYAAARLNWSVVRSDQAYAAMQAKTRQLIIGTPETLDSDDSAAQLILHELCHAITEGPNAATLDDWGLDNTSERDAWREQACLRLQASLCTPWQLRYFFAPTTPYKDFYAQLPADPLTGDDVDTRVAREAYQRAQQSPWHEVLTEAFTRSRQLVDVIQTAAVYRHTRWKLDS